MSDVLTDPGFVPEPQRAPSRRALRGPASKPAGPRMPWPWQGVRWSLSYAAFTLYVLVMTTYQLGIGDVAMAVALAALPFEKTTFRFPSLLAWMGALWLWAAAGYFFTEYPEAVSDRLLVLGKLWLIVLVAVNVLSSRPRIRFFLVFWVACYMLYPARGTLVNYFIGGYTWFGRALWNFIYSNPNDLAALSLLQLAIAAGLLVKEKQRWVKLGALASVLVLPLVILLTQSRGAFLGLAAFVLMALTGGRRRMRTLALVAVAGASALFLVPGSAWDRFGSLAGASTDEEAIAAMDKEGSAQQRWEIWKTAVQIIRDHPVTGVGMGAYPEANALYAGAFDANTTNAGTRDTHSTYLNVLAELGWPGLFIFLAMVGTTIFSAEKRRRYFGRSDPDLAGQLRLIMLGFLGFMVAAVFASYARLSFPYLVLAVIYSIAAVTAGEIHEKRRRLARHLRGQRQYGRLP